MKLPKRRRRVVAVEAPRRIRRTGPGQGSISGGPGGGRNGDGKYHMTMSVVLRVNLILRYRYMINSNLIHYKNI